VRQSLKTLVDTRRIRLRRNSKAISRDILAGFVLTGGVGLVSMIMIFAYFLVLGSPYFRVADPTITGCSRVTEKDVLALSEIKSDQNLFTLNKQKIIRKIMTNPWIEDATIRTELPGRIQIDIKERKPVALMRKDRALYYVDGKACAFKKLEDDEISEFPILTGFCRNGMDNVSLIRKCLDLLDFLAKHDGFPRLEHVSEVCGDETFGFSIFADNGVKIRLGFGNYADKIKRLGPIMADLARRNMVGFFFVDLNNPAKVTVQMRDVPDFPKFSKGYRT
jgi:cell division septal protein FtsQ